MPPSKNVSFALELLDGWTMCQSTKNFHAHSWESVHDSTCILWHGNDGVHRKLGALEYSQAEFRSNLLHVTFQKDVDTVEFNLIIKCTWALD